MIFEKALERSFVVTDRALRYSFPEDYHKRCMYAAFGIQTLLNELGHEASIVGGDMMAFMVSRSQRDAGMQGFAMSAEGHAHYWVEAAGRLIDIGPHYLERDATFPAMTVPLIGWDTQETLPPFLRYRAAENFGPKAVLLADEVIQDRMAAFVDLCRKKLAGVLGQPKPPHWILTGQKSFLDHGAKGDLWVRNAMRFSSMKEAVAGLPF